METIKNLALVMTILINAAALIGVILKVSSAVFVIKQSISDLRSDMQKRLIETEHLIRILEMKVADLYNQFGTERGNQEKTKELMVTQFQTELRELEAEVRENRSHLRDLENYVQKVHPDFHIRSQK